MQIMLLPDIIDARLALSSRRLRILSLLLQGARLERYRGRSYFLGKPALMVSADEVEKLRELGLLRSFTLTNAAVELLRSAA